MRCETDSVIVEFMHSVVAYHSWHTKEVDFRFLGEDHQKADRLVLCLAPVCNVITRIHFEPIAIEKEIQRRELIAIRCKESVFESPVASTDDFEELFDKAGVVNLSDVDCIGTCVED